MDTITEAIHTVVRRATMQLMTEHPFYGIMSVYLALVDDSEVTKTFGTDGTNLFYNKDFFAGLTIGEMKFLLTQVNLMIMTDALTGISSEKSNQFARASDYIFSDMIVTENLGKIGKTIASLVDYDKSLINKDMTPREALEELKKKEGENDDPSRFIDHRYNIKLEDDDEGTSGRSALISRMKSALGASGATGSSIPAGIRALLAEFDEPKIDYKKHIAEFTQSVGFGGTTFDTFNKRSTDEYTLPGKKPEKAAKYAFLVDTSGSMNDEMIHNGLSEIVGSAEQFADYEIHVFCYDHAVHNYQVFTPDNIEELKLYKCEGGGGTVFNAGFEFMKTNKIEVDKVILFTDGYDSGDCGFEYRDMYDVLFVIHSHHGKFEPGFGEVTYYK